MTSEAPTKNTPNKLISRIPRRLRVVSIGIMLLILASANLCLLAALKTMHFSPEWLPYWLMMLTGPFAGLISPSDGSPWAIIGTINLLFILAHPIWPNRITAAITLLAFPPWLFWGFAVAFSGV